jgi:predicted signal transduction protein with EAL and GGDEF domain
MGMSSSTSMSAAAGRGSRLSDRDALFRDLGEAVESGTARSVLVVIGFEGLREYLDGVAESAGDELLDRLGERLLAAGDGTNVYRSRRGEFCLLFEGGLEAIRSLLVVLPSELDEIGCSVGVRASLGIALLPDEATVPTYALALADRRIRALSGEVRGQIR